MVMMGFWFFGERSCKPSRWALLFALSAGDMASKDEPGEEKVETAFAPEDEEGHRLGSDDEDEEEDSVSELEVRVIAEARRADFGALEEPDDDDDGAEDGADESH